MFRFHPLNQYRLYYGSQCLMNPEIPCHNLSKILVRLPEIFGLDLLVSWRSPSNSMKGGAICIQAHWQKILTM